jgi:hypothetical protein
LSEPYIANGRSLRLFLEGMKNVNSLGESRDIDNTKRTGQIPHTYFTDAPAYTFHWLPIVRVETSLNLV